MDEPSTTSVDLPAEPVNPRGLTLATLGFVMAAAAPILMLVVTAIAGLDDLGFFVVTAAVAVLGAFLVRRRGTVPKVIAIVLAVLVGVALSWTAEGLGLPASFLDFVPAVLLIPGALLAIGGTISAIQAAKRGIAGGSGERRAALVIVTVVGVLVFVSAGLTITGRDTVDEDLADDADLVVTMSDFEFDEESYELPPGGTVLVKNDDPFFHTFTVEDLDIDVDLGPYSEELVEISGDAGTYVLFCEPHTEDKDDPGEHDMAAELTVG